jgi:hypothetical protein
MVPPLHLILASGGASSSSSSSAPVALPPWFRVLLDDGTNLSETGPYEDLVTAFVGWCRSDPDLLDAFPGGFVNARAAPRQEYPYLRLTEAVLSDEETDDDREWELTFSAYASSDSAPDEQARRLVGYLLYRLDDKANRPPLRYDVWVEAAHLATGPSELNLLAPVNNLPCWRCDQAVRFRVVRDPDAQNVSV